MMSECQRSKSLDVIVISSCAFAAVTDVGTHWYMGSILNRHLVHLWQYLTIYDNDIFLPGDTFIQKMVVKPEL